MSPQARKSARQQLKALKIRERKKKKKKKKEKTDYREKGAEHLRV